MNAFFSHTWGLQKVFHSFLGGRCIVYLLNFADPLNWFWGSLKCFNMSHFQRAAGCFQTWIDTVWVTGCTASAALFSTISLFHKCEIQTTTQSMWLRKGRASEPMLPSCLRRSVLVVCVFLSSSNQWHNKSFRGLSLGEHGHTWMSRKWTQFLGCHLSEFSLILLCLFKVNS